MSAIERLVTDDGRDLARAAVRQLGEEFRRPAFRAGLGATMLSTAILARLGARASVAVITSLLIGAAIEQLYEMAEDVHGQLAGPELELMFHGADCPGHTTGPPADCCMKANYAPGEV